MNANGKRPWIESGPNLNPAVGNSRFASRSNGAVKDPVNPFLAKADQANGWMIKSVGVYSLL